MKETEERIIAVCGLELHWVSPAPGIARRQGSSPDAGRWWHAEGWLEEGEGVDEVLARGPHCLGCRGDRSKHWSANCWILQCCVDEKGLASCHACDAFPCERLVEWSKESPEYAEALNRLQSMREV